MTATQILSGVRERGGDLVWDGERVMFRGVPDLLTPRLLDSLKQHKEQIVRLLADEMPTEEELNDKAARYSQPATDVQDVIIKAGRPVLYSQIVKEMVGRGFGKQAAKEGISHCQGQGWIYHNLVTGYELAKLTREDDQ